MIDSVIIEALLLMLLHPWDVIELGSAGLKAAFRSFEIAFSYVVREVMTEDRTAWKYKNKIK